MADWWLQGISRELLPSDAAPVEGAPVVAPFPEWLTQVTPNYDWTWRHLVYTMRYLEKVTTGEIKRLLIVAPPRIGKSEMTTIRYPVWRMDRMRTFRVCVGAHSQTFANKFGRRSRRIASMLFPISGERHAAAEWETPEGGVYRSCGVGAPPTGEGFDILFIDDPIKRRKQAESEAFREMNWEWYTDDLYTRLEPDGAIIAQMARWHEDDLAGRILGGSDARNWTIITLPALALEKDPLGRKSGEALCPQRYTREDLLRIESVMGAYSFGATYQGNPCPREGSFFKIGQLKFIEPGDVPRKMEQCRAWDMGATEGSGSYTAGVKMGCHGGRFFLLDVHRGQWDTFQRDEEIKATAQRDGKHVIIRGPQDPGAGGKDSSRRFVRMLPGYRVRTKRPVGAKTLRADPLSSQVNGGNVYIVRGEWNDPLIDELRRFPNGRFDDQVDGASDAHDELTSRIRLEAV